MQPPLFPARDALAAVREAGGRSIVITGKHEPNARLHMAAAEFDVSSVHGDVFGPAKGDVLLAEGAQVYVGDHPGDIDASRAGQTISVAVATGGYRAEDLADAGADVVLPDLTFFRRWLHTHLGDVLRQATTPA